MKLIYILLLFAIGFYACIEADIDYKFDYEERPASIGFLDSVWGIRVWVGKTASVLGKDSSKVAGAEASFHTISGLISSLKSIGNGNFILDNPTALNLTDKFYFKSKSINFPNELTSNQEGIPAQVNLKKVDIVKIGNGSGRDIFIEFDDPPGFNAYVTYIQRFKKDTAMDEDFNADPTFLPFYSGLINDREFNGRRHTLRIENYQIEKVIDQRRNQEADSLKVTLFSVSKSLFDLYLSLNTPEPSTGDPFFDPTILPNQSQNGIGILSSYAQSSKGVKIK